MEQIWKEEGFLCSAPGPHPWLATHTSMPFAVPDPHEPEALRLYYSPRDKNNTSHVALAYARRTGPQEWSVTYHSHPLIVPGPEGAFDETGVMGSWFVEDRFYYIGWARGKERPFHLSIGLAISTDGIHFQKAQDTAVFTTDDTDPTFVTTPCVWQEESLWHMIYASGGSWPSDGKETWPVYDFYLRTSHDGLSWQQSERKRVLSLKPGEVALARPSLYRTAKGYHLWYSYRLANGPYRIGYAYSQEGKEWQRLDEMVHLPDLAPWAHEMQCYPHIFSWHGDLWMIYAGNDFGQGGMGLRRLLVDLP